MKWEPKHLGRCHGFKELKIILEATIYTSERVYLYQWKVVSDIVRNISIRVGTEDFQIHPSMREGISYRSVACKGIMVRNSHIWKQGDIDKLMGEEII